MDTYLEHRELRGSSGGNRGGGGGGGSGFEFSGTDDDDGNFVFFGDGSGNDGVEDLSFFAIIGTILFAVITFLISAFCFYRVIMKRLRKKRTMKRFAKARLQARKIVQMIDIDNKITTMTTSTTSSAAAIEEEATTTDANTTNVATTNANQAVPVAIQNPMNGTYLGYYEEGGHSHRVTMQMTFWLPMMNNTRNNLNGPLLFSITGHGDDADGSFSIIEGQLNVGTGQIYWVERANSSESGSSDGQRLVLNTGIWDFGSTMTVGSNAASTAGAAGQGLKQGQWMANNGISGSFESFQQQVTHSVANNVMQSVQPIATTQESGPPMITATSVP